MSRIGNQILSLPSGVEFKVDNNEVSIKGPKGTLTKTFVSNVEVKLEDGQIKVTRNSEDKFSKSIHGTTTALIKNMIVGVSEGFIKELELNGVGYRANVAGKTLNLNVGFSHPVDMVIPDGLTVEVEKNTAVKISGIDNQLVGEFAAKIRKVRPPEPYKGKGIKYKEEIIRRKEGKRAGS